MDRQSYADPIFKGATRPAMVFGVPIIPFVVVAGSHLVVAMWLLAIVGGFWLVVVMAACGVELLFLRLLCKHDAQRVHQAILYFMARPHRRNATTWGAHSMSPIDPKKRPQST